MVAVALLGACTLGVRARGAFVLEHPLEGASAVIIDLPSTPVAVRGCDGAVPESCPDALQVAGWWHAVGGTSAQARRTAERPALSFTAHEGLVRVDADIPLEVEGLVDLELDEVTMPDEIDLEVRSGLGDVQLRALAGSVLVDAEVGDVDVRGPMRSTGIRVGEGQVVFEGAGPLDVRVQHGGVRAEQTAGAAQARIVAPAGDVELMLGDDADVDLTIESAGRIRVQTDAFSAATTGLYRARSGTGATRVEIEAGGDVAVRLRP